jgi:ABC-2 type transport system permease protein
MNATLTPTLVATPATAHDAAPRVTERSVVRSEWIKFRSLRSNLIGVASAAGALVALGMMFSSLTGEDTGGPPAAGGGDTVSIALGGMTLSQLIIGVLAAGFVTSEYTSGLIRTMFSAVADRTPVLRAKAMVFGGATWIVMTIAAFAAFFAGRAVYAGSMSTYSITDPGVLRAVLGAGVYGAGVALIGVALGFLLRSAATAIGVLVGTLMIAPVLVGLLPSSISDWLSKILPSNAGTAFMSVSGNSDLLSPAAGFAVFAAWVVGLLGLAVVMVKRRDA